MKKSTLWTILAIILVIAICTVPLFLKSNADSEFGGADGQAGDIAQEIDPSFEPWIDNFWAPPGGETESLLFALQAALGAGVFCYFIGYFAGQKKQKKLEEAGKTADNKA